MKKAGAGDFSAALVKKALQIPRGRVTTYARLAKAAGGHPAMAQRITGILARAYDKGETRIPFHRIVYADGRVWLDTSDIEARLRRYEDEGIEIEDGKVKDFAERLFEF